MNPMSLTLRRSSPRRVRHALRIATRNERGFSLIVSLMMLIVIIILGVSGAQMSVNEERGSRNDRDRQIAFQAAEAALKDAEYEIYGATGVTCTLPTPQLGDGNMRSPALTGTQTCFNAFATLGFVPGCSAPPNAGLCAFNPTLPAYLDSTNVDFFADAKGTGNSHTVAYGTFTGRTYGTQSGFPGQPLSAYPPRYIIEWVPKNTSVDTLTDSGTAVGNKMFRVTAMGFGANPNSQVVLQAIVATSY
jgi:type IV pilus assembly protein PilX